MNGAFQLGRVFILAISLSAVGSPIRNVIRRHPEQADRLLDQPLALPAAIRRRLIVPTPA